MNGSAVYLTNIAGKSEVLDETDTVKKKKNTSIACVRGTVFLFVCGHEAKITPISVVPDNGQREAVCPSRQEQIFSLLWSDRTHSLKVDAWCVGKFNVLIESFSTLGGKKRQARSGTFIPCIKSGAYSLFPNRNREMCTEN